MTLVIEPGRREDAPVAAKLTAETDVELFRRYGGGDLSLWTTIAEWEWRGEEGIYSHTMSQVARLDGALVGLLVSYSPERDARIDWALGCSRPHIEASRWAQLNAERPLAAFLFPAIPKDAYYIQNVVTAPEAQGMGLGRRFMELAFAQGRVEGCRTCHLDVDGSTPAVQFYEYLGLRVLVKTEVLGLPGVHAHYRMAIDL
jgi:ribosomal protein S18 acetylase RimI-like enzyme